MTSSSRRATSSSAEISSGGRPSCSSIAANRLRTVARLTPKPAAAEEALRDALKYARRVSLATKPRSLFSSRGPRYDSRRQEDRDHRGERLRAAPPWDSGLRTPALAVRLGRRIVLD